MADFIHDLESCEIAAWGDFYRAASRESAEACGLKVEEVGGGLVTVASRIDTLALNRALGIGLNQPATEHDVDQIVRFLTEERIARFFVQVSPVATPDELPRWLEARGFQHYNNWVRLHRDVSPTPEVKTDLVVREVDRQHAADFGHVVVSSFDWAEFMIGWVADLVGRPGWRHYMAFDGDTPAATGAMFVGGEFGWLDFAATLSTHRKRGAQSAILARRIHDAAELGCRWVLVETAEQTPEKEAPSYRNMIRFGFTEAYKRPNYIHENRSRAAR
jgi:hypothetical protein